jgi:hypothetical protein
MELYGNGIKELINLMAKDISFKSPLYDEEAGTVVESYHTIPCPKEMDENGKVKTYFDNDAEVRLEEPDLNKVVSMWEQYSPLQLEVMGMRVYRRSMGPIENLPEPKEGVVYIIPLKYLKELKGYRKDCISPMIATDYTTYISVTGWAVI